MKTIKIMVLDRHSYYRECLIHVLKLIAPIKIIGEASKTTELLELLKKRKPDIIFFDLDVLEMQHYEYLTLIKTQYPTVKVIALSLNNSNYMIGIALKSGANAFLPKNTSIVVLIENIENTSKILTTTNAA